jgi:tetratricopeptide (TPR) repeat protein
MLSVPHTPSAPPGERERVAGRYELIERLAQGGMGEVFAVRELATSRTLALKRLLPTALKRQALFRAEYHVLARLKHPFIIQVYEFGVDKNLPYYTMELLDGYDLREAPQVTVEEGCRILRDVASSLALLHAQRLLHRDVSPRNVRRTSSGLCKLLDFGTMVPFGVPPNLAGTPPFLSPEAWEGAPLDQRADLYSLGAVAYWLFSRRLPGNARSLERRPQPQERLPLLRKVGKDIPHALDELVMSLLEHDPSRRPSSAHEVIARLSAIGELAPVDSLSLAGAHLGSSRFLGQKRAIGKTERLLSRALTCYGGGLLVEGDEGSGKTRFLQEISLRAQTQGFSVVRAFAGRSASASSVARELYRGLRRAAPEALERVPTVEREALRGLDADELGEGATPVSGAHVSPIWAISTYFRQVARTSPWLVVVDDLDLADESSIGLVGALSAMAETLPLLVLASGRASRGDEAPLSYLAFAQRAQRVELEALDPKRVRTLVSDALGRIPNRERLVDYLYRGAHGNPGMTLELCRFLLERGAIRYVDGSFVLPDSEIREQPPAPSTLGGSLRLEGLSDAARALAELVASCRGGAALELCLHASAAPGDEVLGAINELVSRGVLVGSGREYAFAHAMVRGAVRLSLAPARAKQLHERLALAYAALGGDGNLRSALEAAFHLLHTEREREAAERLITLAPTLIEAGVAVQDAIEALEKALEVLERHGASLETRLEVRTHLARASYTHDYRLAQRHAERTIALLRGWCAMPTVERLRPVLPAPLAALACLAVIAWRRLFWSGPRRGPSAITTLRYFLRIMMSTLGVRLTALDRAGSKQLFDQFWLLRGLSVLPALSAVYRAADALVQQTYGREVELRERLALALAPLDKPIRRMQEAERQDLRVGLLLSGGINECYRIGSRALALADELAAQGTSIAQASAHRIRFTYYVVRGMREKAEEYRRELDIHGLQGGTTWQVEWFAVPTEGMTSARLGDLVGTAQALSRLERLAAEVPALVLLRDMLKVGYHMRRGEHAQAIQLGRRYVAQHPPGAMIGWGSVYAMLAGSLNETHRYAEALELCERALAALSPAELEYEIMYGALLREQCVAYAGGGELEKGLALAESHAARLEAAGEYALLAHAQECRARVARMTGKHDQLASALIAVRDAAERSGSSTVIEQAAKVIQANLRATHGGEYRTPEEVEDGFPSSTSDVTPPGGIARTRRRTLLRRVMQRAGAASVLAVTVLPGESAPRVAASAGKALPTSELALALLPLAPWLEREPQAGADESEEHAFELTIGDRTFAALRLSRAEANQPPLALLLEHGAEGRVEVPRGLLSRLADELRLELSLGSDAPDASVSSEVSQTSLD